MTQGSSCSEGAAAEAKPAWCMSSASSSSPCTAIQRLVAVNGGRIAGLARSNSQVGWLPSWRKHGGFEPKTYQRRIPTASRGRHYGFWQNRWDGEGLRFRRPQKMAELQIPKPRSFSILAKVNFVCCSVLSSAGAQIPGFDLHAWPSRLGEQHQSCSRLINPSLQST